MEKINQNDFYKYLEEESIIEDKEIDLKYVDLKNIEVAHFQNCNFTSSQINFDNSDREPKSASMIKKTNISFHNCSFNDLLIMGINNLGRVNFFNTEKVKSIKISSCSIDSLVFQNNIAIDYKIEIFYCHLLECFDFSKNDFTNKGFFNLLGNTFYKSSTILNNTFNILEFKKLYFKDSLAFKNEFIENSSSLVLDSEFEEVTFNKSNFSNLIFNKCVFLNTVWFAKCRNLNKSELRFIACKFEKYSLFDNSKFNKIGILHSKFLEKASFENFETNYFEIHQVTFAEAAYFDDLNKNNNKAIENWDRKTLRAIKRELVNTHNQIDYLRFKAYELNAYDKEKGKNCKDQIVLFFNKHSNYFGLDWTKGVCFILSTSLLFYLLYLITYAIVMKHTIYFPNTVEDFFVTYLKFLNPFSFLKSPIDDAEKYFFPYLSFTLGKIFISYGIYQTIQAFRKFGVNGG